MVGIMMARRVLERSRSASRKVQIARYVAHQSNSSFGGFAIAGSAGACALLLATNPVGCSYQDLPDGKVDRLARWRRRSWGIKFGSSPGFHLRSINPLLEKYLGRFSDGLGGKDGASVLVPLCGKSVDLPFLCEQGFRVVGVEGCQRPILELKAEHRVRLKEFKERAIFHQKDGVWVEGAKFEPSDEFRGSKPGYVFGSAERGVGYYSDSPAVWRGRVRLGSKKTRPLHIVEADMFDVSPDMVKALTFEDRGVFDMVYDRGGLDSVPVEARADYVSKVGRLLVKGGRVLLIVTDYDQAKVPIDRTGKRLSPPPFSVPESEVRRLFPASHWDVTLLEKQVENDGLMAGNPAFHGVDVLEATYLITKKGDGSGIGAAGKLAVGLAALGVAGCLGPKCLT